MQYNEIDVCTNFSHISWLIADKYWFLLRRFLSAYTTVNKGGSILFEKEFSLWRAVSINDDV